MNNYIVRQKDIELLMQSDKTLFYKLELLNEDLKVLDCIEGNLISDNISISSDSDIRRTYSCEMLVTDSTFDISYDKKIWFDKRIRPYIGILHQRSQEVVYYLLGTFLFTEANFSYDETTHTLSLTCLDMMALLNGTRGGNIDAYKRTITAGTSARSVIINLLEEVGITKYLIEFNLNNQILSDFEIPYDMTYNAGMNVYNIIKEIIDLYGGTEMYFDLYGTFIIDRIPTSENEQIILNDEILQPILISEQLSTNFTDIYNDIEIWGRVQEPDYYSQNVTYSDGIYNVNVIVYKLDEDTGEYTEVSYDNLDNFDTFSFKIPCANTNNQTYININNLGNILIVKEDEQPLEANVMTANTDYVFRYKKLDNTLLFLGQYQAHCKLYISNDESNLDENAVIDKDNKYAVEKIGHKLKVLSGGDYENIYSDELCRQRCKYELYNATNRQDNLTINTVAICWLDVNQVIEFTSNSNGNKDKYIINNISCNYADHTMSISANRYFANYI